MSKDYKPEEIESAAQKFWEEQQSFKSSEDLSREKFFCLAMFPYPSGRLHMGHIRNYTIGDVIARFQRMRGKNVLQPFGWDAFGLPAENAAIKHGVMPSQWTYQNIDTMRAQIKRLGFAYDWKKEIATCNPKYYRWEQWFFIKLYEKGLAYRKKSWVNWDPIDQTVLANEQVVNGRGWRSGALVERRQISQWFLKITEYAEELLSGLDTLTHWPESVVSMQRNWIGRSEGAEVYFKVCVEESDPNVKGKVSDQIKVYTTRPDTLMGVTYIALSAQHPLVEMQSQNNAELAAFITECSHVAVSEAVIETLEKKGMSIGIHAIHPLTGEKLPVWVANFVVMDYGTGAVMSVPAHDERDFEFALKYRLPIKPVIFPENSDHDFNQSAYIDPGILKDSGDFTGLTSSQARLSIIATLESHQVGKGKVQFRLRDWGVSRQRYWGAPIPIIYCEDCGPVAVPESDLPVILPEQVDFKDSAAVLRSIPEFYDCICPQCKKPAKRETDTFDTFVESSWYYARFTCKNQEGAMLDDRARYWTPVDSYIGGIEHAVMHLLYARFIHKAMRDLNLINSDEPFTHLLTQGMVLKDGTKMSKSKGNVVDASDLVDRYGADTVRLFMMFAAPPEQSLEWSDTGVEGSYRFLKKLWNFAQVYGEKHIRMTNYLLSNDLATAIELDLVHPEQRKVRRELYEILKQARYDFERYQFNTVVSAAMKILNLLSKLSLSQNENETDYLNFAETGERLIHEGFSILLRLLAPITPHVCHYLWQELGYDGLIIHAKWPRVLTDALVVDHIEIVIQINGKLRSQTQIPINASASEVEKLVLEDDKIQKFIADKTIRKIIYIPSKLVNVVCS